MILFSIAVHEQPLVIVNQIENFRYFNPDCQIVLHFSAAMSQEEFLESVTLLRPFSSFVHVNETRLWSGYGDGTQMKMHVVNYLYAQKLNLAFDYFCLHASNDMFVSFGLKDFVKKFDAGFAVPELGSLRWVHLERAKHDWCLKKMMKKHHLPKLIGGQVEGAFYSNAIMNQISERIMADGMFELPSLYAHGTSKFWSKVFNQKYIRAILRRVVKGFLYAKEEIYFITLSQDLIQTKANYNYCYINWMDGLNISLSDIEHIRDKEYGALAFYNKLDFSDNKIALFAVKRVDRKINDPIRQYITSLQQ